MLSRTEALTERIVTRSQATVPAYAAISAGMLTQSVSTLLDRILGALRDGRSLSAEDVRALRDFGEVRARQGISLAAIQVGWWIAVREIFAELTYVVHTDGVPDSVLTELTRGLLDIVDQATVAYTVGHRDVEIELVRHDQEVRSEFTRAVLLGGLSPGELTVRAQQFGLDPNRSYRAFRMRGSEIVVNPRRAASELIRAAQGYTTGIDGDIAGFVEEFKVLDGSESVGVGPLTGLSELDRSFRLAGRILATAQLYGITGPVDLDRLGLRIAIAADPDLGIELGRRYLDPVGVGEQARIFIETVEVYLDAGRRVDLTAARLIVHPNTIRYRLTRFEELTGADLRAAHTVLLVWWAIQYRRARG
ncbi:CdaR family transcriptional regulator [Nocardia sp. SYP-A9097]|uniref:PucR family transcriptional regulator n=1 Tax=Nocardia sp. SYP-A9097 TaxID=2663237 RepID=UPI001891F04B|nr:helix-turn-helix domain-containing protein [Nocardia sp. SYP-A9097]